MCALLRGADERQAIAALPIGAIGRHQLRGACGVHLQRGTRGSVMRPQFEYEAPSLRRKVALALKAPHKWRSRVRPWVFDKKSGVRFQLGADEHAALKPLTSRLRNGSTSLPVAVAFNEAAAAILDRRRGYCFEWELI